MYTSCCLSILSLGHSCLSIYATLLLASDCIVHVTIKLFLFTVGIYIYDNLTRYSITSQAHYYMLAILLCSAETWCVTEVNRKRFEAFHWKLRLGRVI